MNILSTLFFLFRSLYKFILHQVTQQTEIERVSRQGDVRALRRASIIQKGPFCCLKCSRAIGRITSKGSIPTAKTSPNSYVLSKESRIERAALGFQLSFKPFLVGSLPFKKFKHSEKLAITLLHKRMRPCSWIFGTHSDLAGR